MSDSYIIENFNSGAALQYSSDKVVLSDFLPGNDIVYVDALKVDTDGYDYQVLLGAEKYIKEKPPLFIQVEVGAGGSGEYANLFAEADTLLRQLGYSLLDLDAWRYSRGALPSRFAYEITAQTVTGPIAWFDVVYVDDPMVKAGKLSQWIAAPHGRDRLMKLIALYDLYGFPDCAAELIVALRDLPETAHWADWTKLLDLLVPENPLGAETYEEYIKAFTDDPKRFLPSRWSS